METVDTSIRHLNKLLAIAEDLAKDGIAIYAHDYRRLSRGSFSV